MTFQKILIGRLSTLLFQTAPLIYDLSVDFSYEVHEACV